MATEFQNRNLTRDQDIDIDKLYHLLHTGITLYHLHFIVNQVSSAIMIYIKNWHLLVPIICKYNGHVSCVFMLSLVNIFIW